MDTRRGKSTWRRREEAAIGEPRREASAEANPADALGLDFQPPGL